MYITDDFLVLTSDSDLTQLKEEATWSYDRTTGFYHYYKRAFIRTYNLTTFPAYYKRSQDGHTWDKISAEFFRKLVIAQLDDLTNRKCQLVSLLGVIQPSVEDVASPDNLSPDFSHTSADALSTTADF